MIKKRQLAVLAIMVSAIMTSAPISAIFYGHGQIQSMPAEELVELADRAEQQVKNLIDLVYANDTAIQKVKDFGLIDFLESNVTLYDQGVGNLTAAHDALEITDHANAVEYAISALSIFREVFSSIHLILEDAGLNKGQLIDNQGLLEAITRLLQRIDWLRGILPEDAPEAVKQLLGDAEALLDLDAARALLLEGKPAEVISNLQEAKELISQVYDYLKEQAEESNAWRIDGYCERVRERIMERFRYGNQTGIDFTDVLESLGYQSENQFMTTLQNLIQTAGSEQNFSDAMQNCEAVSQMVQQMEQALNQEINQQQGQYGPSSSSGYGGSGSGYGGSGGS